MSATELTQKQCQAAANNAVNTAMCIIKNGLDLHFNRDRDFMNALLGELLPSNVVVRFEDGVTSIQVDTAEPQVTITRGSIVYVPKNANMSNEFVRFDGREKAVDGVVGGNAVPIGKMRLEKIFLGGSEVFYVIPCLGATNDRSQGKEHDAVRRMYFTTLYPWVYYHYRTGEFLQTFRGNCYFIHSFFCLSST